MTMRLSVRWKKDRRLQFRLALFTGGSSYLLCPLGMGAALPDIATQIASRINDNFHTLKQVS
ncbi:hypothetical protein JS22_003690 [Salmonella enterica subsp. enterica serovar Vinohrady]|nr:hypothetical protein [Salmonella enterica subsp. enterica serovar Vinohrady]